MRHRSTTLTLRKLAPRVSRALATFMVAAAGLAVARPSSGQDIDDRPDLRLRWGGLSMSPRVEVVGGFDNNVFNTVERPTSDFVWTLRPRTDAALRIGRLRMSGNGGVDVVHFQQTRSERSVNVDATGRIGVALNRVRPYVAGSFLRTRQRPNFDIDARSRRLEYSESAGVTLRISALTSLELSGTRARVEFDQAASFLGTSLSNELDRSSDTLRVMLREQLTPLTAVTVTADRTRETFTYSPGRDWVGDRAILGIELAETALISGRASIGYRRFDLHDPLAQDFAGPVAAGELGYTLMGSTRFQVQLLRDAQSSQDPAAPYFVTSLVGGGLTQQLSGALGVVIRASRSRMGFRGFQPSLSRVEQTDIYGGSIVKRFGRTLRFESAIDYVRRTSPLDLRGFSGLRVNNTLVHGL
jgi:Putative beta-barrel porin 2